MATLGSAFQSNWTEHQLGTRRPHVRRSERLAGACNVLGEASVARKSQGEECAVYSVRERTAMM